MNNITYKLYNLVMNSTWADAQVRAVLVGRVVLLLEQLDAIACAK